MCCFFFIGVIIISTPTSTTTPLQVKSIKADNKTISTSRDALDLFEATKISTENGPINSWDEYLVTQVIDILETHPVREVNCPYGLEQPVS